MKNRNNSSTRSPIYPTTHPPNHIHPFTHQLNHLFINQPSSQSPIYPIIHPSEHPSIQSPINYPITHPSHHTSIQSPIHPITQQQIYPNTHSPNHIHPFAHQLSHLFINQPSTKSPINPISHPLYHPSIQITFTHSPNLPITNQNKHLSNRSHIHSIILQPSHPSTHSNINPFKHQSNQLTIQSPKHPITR